MSLYHSNSLIVWSFRACAYFRTSPLRQTLIWLREAVLFSCQPSPVQRISASFDNRRWATCCLMNLTTNHMNNGVETISFATALINVSDWDDRPKRCDMTSSPASQLNNLTTIVSRNQANAVLVPINAALLLSLKNVKGGFLDLILDLPLSALRLNANNVNINQDLYFHYIDPHHDVGTAAVVRAFVFRRCSFHWSVNLLIR